MERVTSPDDCFVESGYLKRVNIISDPIGSGGKLRCPVLSGETATGN